MYSQSVFALKGKKISPQARSSVRKWLVHLSLRRMRQASFRPEIMGSDYHLGQSEHRHLLGSLELYHLRSREHHQRQEERHQLWSWSITTAGAFSSSGARASGATAAISRGVTRGVLPWVAPPTSTGVAPDAKHHVVASAKSGPTGTFTEGTFEVAYDELIPVPLLNLTQRAPRANPLDRENSRISACISSTSRPSPGLGGGKHGD